MERINDLHIKGLCKDTLRATTNHDIFMQIFAEREQLKNIDTYDSELFNYLFECSRNNTILHLARLFDSRNKSYPTRCIDSLIHELIKSDLVYSENILTPQNWPKFLDKYELVLKAIFIDEPIEKRNYLTKLQTYISEQKRLEGSPIEKLKRWRDKYLVHNEQTEVSIDLEDEEIKFLLDIPNSLVYFIRHFLSNMDIVVLRPNESYFITHLLNKTLGK